jgi:hypothetical protein
MTTHSAARTVQGLTFHRRTYDQRPYRGRTVWWAELNGVRVAAFHSGGSVDGRWYPYLRDWRNAVCDWVGSKS